MLSPRIKGAKETPGGCWEGPAEESDDDGLSDHVGVRLKHTEQPNMITEKYSEGGLHLGLIPHPPNRLSEGIQNREDDFQQKNLQENLQKLPRKSILLVVGAND